VNSGRLNRLLRTRFSPLLCCGLSGLLFAAGCKSLPPGKPLASLTPEEARGRAVFVAACARCHNAYDTQALHGPSLYGVYRKPYLPSGAPARDDRVAEVILRGRGMMPAAGRDLTEQELGELLRYLHTL
jgi:mono/diheme cytochrome c family protein